VYCPVVGPASVAVASLHDRHRRQVIADDVTVALLGDPTVYAALALN